MWGVMNLSRECTVGLDTVFVDIVIVQLCFLTLNALSLEIIIFLQCAYSIYQVCAWRL